MSTPGSSAVEREEVAWSDRARQGAVSATFVLCILANLVGAGVIGSREVSAANNAVFAADATLLTPASTAFSIWSVIYLGLAAYLVVQWRPDAACAARHRATGWLVVAASVLNAVWLQVALEGLLWLSVTVIVVLAGVLAEIVRRLNTHPGSGAERITDAVFGAYVGWVSVAVVGNVAATVAAGNAANPLTTPVAVAALVVIAAVYALMAWAWGRVAVAAIQAWGLLWVAYGRLAGEPASVSVGIVAAIAACAPLVVVLARVRTR